MLIATHSLVGAFIGGEVTYPPLAFLLGFISHLLLDSIPHSDGPDDIAGKNDNDPNSKAQYLLVFIDGLVALIVFYFLYQNNDLTLSFLAGAVGGIFPDIIDNVPLWKKSLRRLPLFKQFHQLHYLIQQCKTPMWLGLLIQYTIAGVSLWLILR